MRPLCPCKGCEDRKPPDCHTGCARYNGWKDSLKSEFAERKKENDRYGSPKRSKKHQRMRLGIK